MKKFTKRIAVLLACAAAAGAAYAYKESEIAYVGGMTTPDNTETFANSDETTSLSAEDLTVSEAEE